MPNQNIFSYDVRHLPIVRTYLERMKIPGIIDQALDCEMGQSPGRVVMGLVTDILSGRSPLYRIKEFFEHQDIKTVIGADISLNAFSDTNIGRVLDRLFEYGTEKLFTDISITAVKQFAIDLKHIHEDTTSVNVWGEYKYSKIQDGVTITHGHSKDLRPDLKQFMFSLLCAEKNIPLLGKVEDGNASDKTINNQVLAKIANYMKRNNVLKQDYIYVADSAVVTPDNLLLLGGCQCENKQKFFSRLPENYQECQRVKNDAVKRNQWHIIGKLATEWESKNRPAALYKSYETTVFLEGQRFRAIVIHSSSLDKRRQKRIQRELNKDKESLQKAIKEMSKTPFACLEDARKISEKQAHGNYHKIRWEISEHPLYKRGRIKKGQKRGIEKIQYLVHGEIIEKKSAIKEIEEKAGCFVLLSNVDQSEVSSRKGLEIYKEQYGIEQNFGFLKDPLIVNDLFLKKPKRIEALGLILLIALMVTRLIERDMQKHLEKLDITITGWNNRQTVRPTMLMLSSKFAAVHVLQQGIFRWFSRPLNKVQLEYLKALSLSQNIFLEAGNAT